MVLTLAIYQRPVPVQSLARCDLGNRQGVTNVTVRPRDALYDEGTLLMPLSWEG